jgi:hypothetical protein
MSALAGHSRYNGKPMLYQSMGVAKDSETPSEIPIAAFITHGSIPVLLLNIFRIQDPIIIIGEHV